MVLYISGRRNLCSGIVAPIPLKHTLAPGTQTTFPHQRPQSLLGAATASSPNLYLNVPPNMPTRTRSIMRESGPLKSTQVLNAPHPRQATSEPIFHRPPISEYDTGIQRCPAILYHVMRKTILCAPSHLSRTPESLYNTCWYYSCLLVVHLLEKRLRW